MPTNLMYNVALAISEINTKKGSSLKIAKRS
jgi:hypothetical protein